MEKPRPTYKLVILGDTGVGKTCLVHRLKTGSSPLPFQDSTIGASFTLLETDTSRFEIWDTAGQERYQSLAPMYTRSAHCAIIVSTPNARQTIDWKSMVEPNTAVVCAQNKCDLLALKDDQQYKVRDEVKTFLISAMTGRCCDLLMEEIETECKEVSKFLKPVQRRGVDIQNEGVGKKNTCC